MRVFTCVLVTLVGLAAVPYVNSQCLSEDIQKNTEYKYKSRNLYKGLTIFTEKFLEAMYKANPNENLFFSPFSLYHALLLAYFGSANQTEKVLKVSSLAAAKESPAKSFTNFQEALQLHWAASKADVFKGYQYEKRYREHYGANASVEFSSVDRFYFANEVVLNSCIEDIIIDETRQLDFKQDPSGSLKEINDFVKMATRDNIPQLLSVGDVTQNTQMVLANAAYFKGSWASKFDAKDTRREIFYSKPDEMSFVQMMSKNGSFNHGKSHT